MRHPPTVQAASRDARACVFIAHKVFMMSFSKRQFLHKSVKLFFILIKIRDKLTYLCGNWLSQNDCIIRRPSTDQAASGGARACVRGPRVQRALYRWHRYDPHHVPPSDMNPKPRSYLTQFVHLLILASQLPHKTVDWMMNLVIVNNKLMILWGS